MSDDEQAKMPASPITAMGEGMAQLREMYESLLASGFTEEQSTRIIAIFLAECTRST